MNFGLILNPPEEEHYILGGLDPLSGYPLLMPDGHGWADYLPQPEIQAKNGFDAINCSNYGTNNCLETIAKFKQYDEFPKDCSERYTGVETGTTPQGNDPHHVIEWIRTVCGEIPEPSLPFSNDITTWNEYYSPNPTGALRLFGARLLKKFKIGHRWVFNSPTWSTDKIDKIKHALQYSPLGISVYGWKQDSYTGFYIKDDTDIDEHWVMLYDYVDGQYWLIYDSYDQTLKKLAWHFNFFAAKNYFIDKIPFTPSTSGWSKFYDWVWSLFKQNGLLGKFLHV